MTHRLATIHERDQLINHHNQRLTTKRTNNVTTRNARVKRSTDFTNQIAWLDQSQRVAARGNESVS